MKYSKHKKKNQNNKKFKMKLFKKKMITFNKLKIC